MGYNLTIQVQSTTDNYLIITDKETKAVNHHSQRVRNLLKRDFQYYQLYYVTVSNETNFLILIIFFLKKITYLNLLHK